MAALFVPDAPHLQLGPGVAELLEAGEVPGDPEEVNMINFNTYVMIYRGCLQYL